MARAHAKLAPSAAARWLECTAAPALEAGYPDETSIYAEEGTLAHSFAEAAAKYSTGQAKVGRYKSTLAKLKRQELFSPEMIEHAEAYASNVAELLHAAQKKTPDAFCDVEVKLDLTEWIPDGFGTADCVIIADDTITVIDYKYGKGVAVEARKNPQMMIYALGALAKYSALYDIELVNMEIIQPRLGGMNGWTITAAELTAWAENTLKPAAEEAASGAGKFCPSEQACRFCKARGECRARADQIVRAFDEAPELTNTLTNDEIGNLLEKAKDMEAWLKDLKDTAFKKLSDGEQVFGWKLVEGRSVRKITDEGLVGNRLAEYGVPDEVIFPRKLCSITTIEKLLGKKDAAEILDGCIEKPKGSPTLAPVSDKRPEYKRTDAILDAFDE